MKKPQHLSNEFLVRFIDDELPMADTKAAEGHLQSCAECKQRLAQMEEVSKSLECFALGMRLQYSEAERETLVVLLDTEAHVSSQKPQRVLERFVWGMALAASLAMGVLIAPHLRKTQPSVSANGDGKQSAGLLQVDGETFVPLPYSNPDLPLAHHIVEMQVAVASLADAGVHFEAISNEVAGNNDSVLADVLLGIDGQPLGVHVLTAQ